MAVGNVSNVKTLTIIAVACRPFRHVLFKIRLKVAAGALTGRNHRLAVVETIKIGGLLLILKTDPSKIIFESGQ